MEELSVEDLGSVIIKEAMAELDGALQGWVGVRHTERSMSWHREKWLYKPHTREGARPVRDTYRVRSKLGSPPSAWNMSPPLLECRPPEGQILGSWASDSVPQCPRVSPVQWADPLLMSQAYQAVWSS